MSNCILDFLLELLNIYTKHRREEMQSLYNELEEKYWVNYQNIQVVSEFNNLDRNPFSATRKALPTIWTAYKLFSLPLH